MAATLQQQPQHPNPQLKRLVYSKYRELLGSYNDKANTIIQALPAYMVTEDKGFNFVVKDDGGGKDEVDFSVPPPPPPTLPANGSLPARRLPASEPPACVQNAMMTKDKKPFTYTPGGIDLSQIKSPRMAKRIARNAQHEGITNQPKPSPLAQNQQNNAYPAGSVPAAPPPPASAMGVPVQVFPTGPPPPPPAPPSSSNISSSSVPPPPPPMASQLAPQTNGRDMRKSPTPQNFEPPPLGCRPEIKIPPNPIASLKKVPKPEPKNDFWIEEYRKERSKSPLPGETQCQEESANQQIRQDAPPRELSPKPTKPPNYEEDNSDPRRDPNRIAFQQQRPVQQYQPQPQQHPQPFYQQQRPMQPLAQAPKQDEPSYPPHLDPNRIAFQQQRQQQPQQQQQQVSPNRTPAGSYRPPTMSPNVQRVDSPFRVQDNPNLQRPLSPVKVQNSPTAYQQQAQQPPYYMRQQQQPQPQYQQTQQPHQNVTSPLPQQQKPTQVGSLYIAPVSPENLVAANEQPRSAGLQQTPPWLSQRPNLKENPEWVKEVNSSPAANRTQTPPIVGNQQSSGGPGLRLQMTQNQTSANPKERIIPIQLEKTPTPTRTPSAPGFGPQPYTPQPYTPSSQYGSVASPGSGHPSPNATVVRNPNQFVDQGYNNWPNQSQQQVQQQRVVSPPVQQQGGGRIIPITIERDDAPFSPTSARGPISPTPMVIQNDPRTPQSPRSNGIPPNQSKSFRVLQKITDTEIAPDSDGEQPAELHGPQYSRQMGDTTDQMRKMQINDSNQQTTFVNRGPIQRQTQRYVQQRPVYQQDDQPQQYVHPSEQQVHEPKIYTGSAIPSRSFKLLQAMTTPENAVETDDSSVVENEPIYCKPLHSFPYPPSTTPIPFFISESKEPPFQPYCYYYPQYDKEESGDFGNYPSDSVKPIEGAPNIIVTEHDEEDKKCNSVLEKQETEKQVDDDEEEKDDVFASMKPKTEQLLEGSARFTMQDLARKLNEISSSEVSPESGRNSPFSFDDDDSRLSKSHSPCQDKSTDSEEDSDDLFTSSSSSSEGCDKGKIHSSSEGLHAIKSVTNIKIYDKCEELEEEQREDNDVDQKATEAQESQTKTVRNKDVEKAGFWIREWDDDENENLDHDMQPVCIVESGSDTDEGDDLTEDIEEVDIRDNLSVIFEESESTEQRKRTQSMNSESSTLSECSTTIANDDQDESYSDIDAGVDKEHGDKNQDNDDEENSVTVRLPLRLSFSRSSNDENITTVVVGDSEIHDSRRSSLKTLEDRDDDFGLKTDNDGQENDNNNDVSVVFSLTSRSNSVDHIGLLSKTSSVDHETSAKDWDDSDSESVSVSISLPMKRNKFMTQTLNNSLTNNVHEMRSDWDEGERDDEKRKNQGSHTKSERKSYTNEMDREYEDTDEEEGEIEEEEEEEAEEETSDEESEDENIQQNDSRKTNGKPLKIIAVPLDDDESTAPVSEMVDALRQLRAFSEEVVKRATLERDLEQKSGKSSLNKRLSIEEIETEATKVFQNVERRKSVERTVKTPVDSDWDDTINRRRSWIAPKVFDDAEEQRNKWFEEFEKDQMVEQSQDELVNEESEKEKAEALEELKRVSIEIQGYEPFRRSVDAESEPLIDLADNLEKKPEVDAVKLTTNEKDNADQTQSQWHSNKLEKTIRSDAASLENQVLNDPKLHSMENGTASKWLTKSTQTEKQSGEPENLNPLEESISFILQETERKCHETINMRNKRIYTETEKKDRAAKRAGRDWQDIFDKNGYFQTQTPYDDPEKDNDSSTSESSSSSSSTTTSDSSANPVAAGVINPLDESLSFVLEQTKQKCDESLLNDQPNEKFKLTVRERIAAFEQSKDALDRLKTPKPILEIASKNTIDKMEILSRNSSVQKSESELEEDDSGVTSDLSKPVSETDTDPECFSELRKMNRYQRAATHSRLFKLLQDEAGNEVCAGSSQKENAREENSTEDEKHPKVILRSKKKIIHNVSITRRSNPEVLKEAETLLERRERLSLPLKASNSIDADNLSTSNSPCSPAIFSGISEKLINELIQSLLMKQGSSHLRDLPWEKLQAAARKVLEESLDADSLENTSIESTPAMTPQDAKNQYQKSYADYYETWNRSYSPGTPTDPDLEIIPSKTFRDLHNQSPFLGQNKIRPVRCPRVLNTKSLNRDLTRVTEHRESASPDLFRSSRSSLTPDRSREFSRASSVSRLGKV